MNYLGASLFSGDPYCGARLDEIWEKNKRIQELEAEVRKLRGQIERHEGRYNTTWGASCLLTSLSSPGLGRKVAKIKATLV